MEQALRQLCSHCVTYDWKDEHNHIKSLVHKYFSEVNDEDLFIIIYDIFQDILTDPSKIICYLNPLKFPGYEQIAMKQIRIDHKLDYSGFIIACKSKEINCDLFLERLKQ